MQVKLVDKELLDATHQDIILVGGAQPCPLLAPNNFVLVRVRTCHGPHPSTSNGLCDYYIPGTVTALPDNIKQGRAVYSMVVFNGKSVTCPRQGILKISRPKFLEVSKYIKETLSCPSVAHKHKDGSYSSGSHSTSLRSTSRSHSITSKCSSHSISRSHTITSYVPTTNGHLNELSCDDKNTEVHTRGLSHSGSTTEKKMKSNSEIKARKRKSNSRSKSSSKSDLQQVLKLQKVQEVLLNQHSKELTALQLHQERMEHYFRTGGDGGMQREGEEEEEEGEIQSCPSTPEQREQGMNTETWREDKMVETDPLTESKAVGTEWSGSECSSTETVILGAKPSVTTINRQEMEVWNEGGNLFLNEHVLARWPDDGWYYRGVVKQSLGDMWFEVADAGHDIEIIHALDIIIDLQDGQHALEEGETVAALHPHYNRSYAPGIVVGITKDSHFSVELYDRCKVLLPRHEVYHLAPAKHQRDVVYLQERESAWVGQAVMARSNTDGLYLPGEGIHVVKIFRGGLFLFVYCCFFFGFCCCCFCFCFSATCAFNCKLVHNCTKRLTKMAGIWLLGDLYVSYVQ